MIVEGYYVSDGRTVSWWHGKGSFIDYTNPSAVSVSTFNLFFLFFVISLDTTLTSLKVVAFAIG